MLVDLSIELGKKPNGSKKVSLRNLELKHCRWVETIFKKELASLVLSDEVTPTVSQCIQLDDRIILTLMA